MSNTPHSSPAADAFSGVEVPSIDSAKYIELATQYAKLRWCWDDESHVREICEQELSGSSSAPESPKSLIDGHADDFGLEDPFAAWGSANAQQKKECNEVEDQIDALFTKSGKSPKP